MTGASIAASSRRTCARCAFTPLVHRQRGAHRAERLSRRVAARNFVTSRRGEALRPHRVHEDRVQAEADLLAQPPLELDRLGHRHLLGQRDAHVAGARRVREHLGHLVGLAADRPDARDLAERPRRREHPDPVAGGGRVDHHEVVRAVVRSHRCFWASSHTFAIVISSFAPGAAATKYWNACECPSTFSAVPPTCLASHSSSAFCGSIVIAHRPSASSTSCSAARPGGRTRATSGPARRPRTRSSAGPSARPPNRARRRPSSCRRRPCPVTYRTERSRNSASTVVTPSGSHGPERCGGYETARRMLRRHDPTYYLATRRLPARAAARPPTPSTATSERPIRSSTARAGRHARRGRRAALDAWEAQLERPRRVLSRCALTDAAAPPPAPARRAAHLHALVRMDCEPRPDLHVGRARDLHGRLGRLGRADHGRAAGRPAATTTPTSAAWPRLPARELHPRRARGPAPGPRLPARRGPRALRRRRGRPAAALQPAPARAARHEVERARALFAAARPAIAAAPASVRARVRLAVGLYRGCSTARTPDRRARLAHPGRGARGASGEARDAARRRAHRTRRAPGRADLRRELRRAGRRP